MLAYRRTAMKPPAGGHRFRDGTVGKSFDDVVRRVTEFRTNNSQPLGHPEQEVLAYYLEIAPHLVEVVPVNVAVDDRQLVAERSNAIICGRYELLGRQEPEVARRLAVCEECPERRQILVSPDSRYWRETESRLARTLLDVAPMRAGWCPVHRWPVLLGARLTDPASAASTGAPQNCYCAKA